MWFPFPLSLRGTRIIQKFEISTRKTYISLDSHIKEKFQAFRKSSCLRIKNSLLTTQEDSMLSLYLRFQKLQN